MNFKKIRIISILMAFMMIATTVLPSYAYTTSQRIFTKDWDYSESTTNTAIKATTGAAVSDTEDTHNTYKETSKLTINNVEQTLTDNSTIHLEYDVDNIYTQSLSITNDKGIYFGEEGSPVTYTINFPKGLVGYVDGKITDVGSDPVTIAGEEYKLFTMAPIIEGGNTKGYTLTLNNDEALRNDTSIVSIDASIYFKISIAKLNQNGGHTSIDINDNDSITIVAPDEKVANLKVDKEIYGYYSSSGGYKLTDNGSLLNKEDTAVIFKITSTIENIAEGDSYELTELKDVIKDDPENGIVYELLTSDSDVVGDVSSNEFNTIVSSGALEDSVKADLKDTDWIISDSENVMTLDLDGENIVLTSENNTITKYIILKVSKVTDDVIDAFSDQYDNEYTNTATATFVNTKDSGDKLEGTGKVTPNIVIPSYTLSVEKNVALILDGKDYTQKDNNAYVYPDDIVVYQIDIDYSTSDANGMDVTAKEMFDSNLERITGTDIPNVNAITQDMTYSNAEWGLSADGIYEKDITLTGSGTKTLYLITKVDNINGETNKIKNTVTIKCSLQDEDEKDTAFINKLDSSYNTGELNVPKKVAYVLRDSDGKNGYDEVYAPEGYTLSSGDITGVYDETTFEFRADDIVIYEIATTNVEGSDKTVKSVTDTLSDAGTGFNEFTTELPSFSSGISFDESISTSIANWGFNGRTATSETINTELKQGETRRDYIAVKITALPNIADEQNTYSEYGIKSTSDNDGFIEVGIDTDNGFNDSEKASNRYRNTATVDVDDNDITAIEDISVIPPSLKINKGIWAVARPNVSTDKDDDYIMGSYNSSDLYAGDLLIYSLYMEKGRGGDYTLDEIKDELPEGTTLYTGEITDENFTFENSENGKYRDDIIDTYVAPQIPSWERDGDNAYFKFDDKNNTLSDSGFSNDFISFGNFEYFRRSSTEDIKYKTMFIVLEVDEDIEYDKDIENRISLSFDNTINDDDINSSVDVVASSKGAYDLAIDLNIIETTAENGSTIDTIEEKPEEPLEIEAGGKALVSMDITNEGSLPTRDAVVLLTVPSAYGDLDTSSIGIDSDIFTVYAAPAENNGDTTYTNWDTNGVKQYYIRIDTVDLGDEYNNDTVNHISDAYPTVTFELPFEGLTSDSENALNIGANIVYAEPDYATADISQLEDVANISNANRKSAIESLRDTDNTYLVGIEDSDYLFDGSLSDILSSGFDNSVDSFDYDYPTVYAPTHTETEYLIKGKIYNADSDYSEIWDKMPMDEGTNSPALVVTDENGDLSYSQFEGIGSYVLYEIWINKDGSKNVFDGDGTTITDEIPTDLNLITDNNEYAYYVERYEGTPLVSTDDGYYIDTNNTPGYSVDVIASGANGENNNDNYGITTSVKSDSNSADTITLTLAKDEDLNDTYNTATADNDDEVFGHYAYRLVMAVELNKATPDKSYTNSVVGTYNESEPSTVVEETNVKYIYDTASSRVSKYLAVKNDSGETTYIKGNGDIIKNDLEMNPDGTVSVDYLITMEEGKGTTEACITDVINGDLAVNMEDIYDTITITGERGDGAFSLISPEIEGDTTEITNVEDYISTSYSEEDSSLSFDFINANVPEQNELYKIAFTVTYDVEPGDILTNTTGNTVISSVPLKVNLEKINADNNEEAVEGATFEAYYSDENGNIKTDIVGNAIPVEDLDGNAIVVTTDEDGKADFEFNVNNILTEDEWYITLKEVDVPVGYFDEDNQFTFRVNKTDDKFVVSETSLDSDTGIDLDNSMIDDGIDGVTFTVENVPIRPVTVNVDKVNLDNLISDAELDNEIEATFDVYYATYDGTDFVRGDKITSYDGKTELNTAENNGDFTFIPDYDLINSDNTLTLLLVETGVTGNYYGEAIVPIKVNLISDWSIGSYTEVLDSSNNTTTDIVTVDDTSTTDTDIDYGYIYDGDNKIIVGDAERLVTVVPPEPSEPTEPSESEDPTDPKDPIETVEPSESSEPTETVEPSESSEPTETVEPNESSKPTETVEPSESSEPNEPLEPTNPSNPSNPGNPTNPTDPSEPEVLVPIIPELPTGYVVEPTEEDGVYIIIDPDGNPYGYVETDDAGDTISIDDIIPFGTANPHTGDYGAYKIILLGGLIIVAGGCIWFIKKSKKDKDKK